jgi:hypothetical protein
MKMLRDAQEHGERALAAWLEKRLLAMKEMLGWLKKKTFLNSDPREGQEGVCKTDSGD